MAHRGLSVLLEATHAALRCEEDGARRAIAALRADLEVHFAQEEHLYYPPIWTLRPEQKGALVEFMRAHEGFRALVADVAEQVARGQLAEAVRLFDAFEDAFRHHEEAEETMLHLIEQQCAAAR
ncbi:MAG: hemerythrin domain-containing protein [Candidatus Binatia bacterium]